MLIPYRITPNFDPLPSRFRISTVVAAHIPVAFSDSSSDAPLIDPEALVDGANLQVLRPLRQVELLPGAKIEVR